jgi:transposase
MEGILTMSQKEADRYKIVSQVEDKLITLVKASEILGISQRQIYRIKSRIKESGAKGVIHKLRGKPSNRGYPKELKEKVITIYRKNYSDYGPTLYSEMLIKYHNISVDHETIRKWLRSEAITTSMRKKRPHRKKRQRRSSFGELLQFDGSFHDWFEGRGAECCLLNCVDDATGRVYLRFALSENTADAMLTMWEYVKKYGIPRSIYTDRGSVYHAEGKLTDFGRAMKELKVELIFAKSPQAKGRVKRCNRTLQDRLVKALRREGISNIA